MTQDEIRERISRTIYVLRFPLAVMVVAIHTYFNEGLTARGGIDIPFSGKWAHEFIHLISITISDCAVPMFFVISGYLFFVKEQMFTWRRYFLKIKGKIFTILIPYIVWNVVTCFMDPSRFVESSSFMKIAGFWTMNPTIGEGTGPWNGPLWFMRDLFIVMMFAPTIRWVIKKTGAYMLLFFAIPYFIFGINNIIPGISIRAFMWFSFGALLVVKFPTFFQYINPVILIPCALLLFLARQLSYSFDFGRTIPIIICHLWIFVSMAFYYFLAEEVSKKTKRLDLWCKLAASGFVIYAMHRLINAKITAIGLMVIGKPALSGLETVILYLLTIIATVIICYVTPDYFKI